MILKSQNLIDFHDRRDLNSCFYWRFCRRIFENILHVQYFYCVFFVCFHPHPKSKYHTLEPHFHMVLPHTPIYHTCMRNKWLLLQVIYFLYIINRFIICESCTPRLSPTTDSESLVNLESRSPILDIH